MIVHGSYVSYVISGKILFELLKIIFDLKIHMIDAFIKESFCSTCILMGCLVNNINVEIILRKKSYFGEKFINFLV